VNEKDSGRFFSSVTVLGEIEVEFFSSVRLKKGDTASNFDIERGVKSWGRGIF
jgi:hypothetical protein